MINIFELSRDIGELQGIPKVASECLTRALVDSMIDMIREGEEFSIPCLGKFKTVERKARVGRNPKTGEVVSIPSRKVVVFKRSSKL